jgi:hypothetical protein
MTMNNEMIKQAYAYGASVALKEAGYAPQEAERLSVKLAAEADAEGQEPEGNFIQRHPGLIAGLGGAGLLAGGGFAAHKGLLGQGAQSAVNSLGGKAQDIGSMIGNKAQGLGSAIGSKAQNIGGAVGGKASDALAAMKGGLSSAGGAVSDKAGDLKAMIQELIKSKQGGGAVPGNAMPTGM